LKSIGPSHAPPPLRAAAAAKCSSWHTEGTTITREGGEGNDTQHRETQRKTTALEDQNVRRAERRGDRDDDERWCQKYREWESK
jgi:hypothetical protein